MRNLNTNKIYKGLIVAVAILSININDARSTETVTSPENRSTYPVETAINSNSTQDTNPTATIIDNTDPIITDCPSDIITLTDPGSTSTNVNWILPNATDNYNIIDFNSTHKSGSSFEIGTTNVVYTATDDSGNVALCNFIITVNDGESPIIKECPQDIKTVVNQTSDPTIVTWKIPTAIDNHNLIDFNSTYESGSTFKIGTTNVVYTATDESGNISLCSFSVTINNSENKSWSNPSDYLIEDNLIHYSNKKRSIAYRCKK